MTKGIAKICPDVSQTRACAEMLCAIGAIVIIFCTLPLGTAIQFGGDEGYELNKAFLCSKGFLLYKQIWNDQPPLFTILISFAFRICSPTIFVARLVAATFGLLLFAAFYSLVRRSAGSLSATLATFLLAASPGVLLLSVSVMLELPAFATALLSAWLLFEWQRRRRWPWLAASGAVMGAALSIKLTAIIVVPALLVEILLTDHEPRKSHWLRTTTLDGLRWAASAIVMAMAVGLLWGKGSYQSSLTSHFASA